ncbi:MAG: diacylglycerol kinase family protein [Propionibacteriaceae bacterium]
MTDTTSPTPRRCAVIYNPIKVSDQFRTLVEDALPRHNVASPLWLETSEDDPGRGMVRHAVEEQVDLVIGAGGDGTIRLIADGLAQSGIPMGLIPAGTGNLLARNLNLPLDEKTALEVALGGSERAIDLIKVTVDDHEPEHFAVMAGVGVDAMIMNETDPDLKSKIGVGAYVVAAGKALGRLPLKVTVQVDGRRRLRRHAMLCLVGNVGTLQGSIKLIADAEPDDGLLDLYIASPQRFTHWVKVLIRMITRRPQKDDQVDQLKGKVVTITIDDPEDYQLDGDALGACRVMKTEIQPGALTVLVP